MSQVCSLVAVAVVVGGGDGAGTGAAPVAVVAVVGLEAMLRVDFGIGMECTVLRGRGGAKWRVIR